MFTFTEEELKRAVLDAIENTVDFQVDVSKANVHISCVFVNGNPEGYCATVLWEAE